MDRQAIMDLLRGFEAGSGPPRLNWRGLEFWPLVRPFLGMELHKSVPFDGLIKPPVSLWSRRAGVVQRMLLRLRAYRRWVRELENQRGNALLITRTNRRRLSGGRPFHRMATPLRHFLDEFEVPLSVWDFDTPPYRDPTAIPTQGLVQWQWMFSPERRNATAPPGDFEALRRFLGGIPSTIPESLQTWAFWQGLFGSVLFRADRYEAWLKQLQPRMVFVDCWYTSEVLPVILAAKRMGIRVIDLQHGIQGATHFGYAGWPELTESSLVPDVFWFWGQRDLQVFESSQNGLRKVAKGLVGGSLELNEVRSSATAGPAPSGREGAARTVLVSEQKGIDINAILVPTIRETLDTVQWMIRPHPGQPESGVRTALGADAARVTFISPGLETVFESLARADIHVTGFSSVALEALALRKKTLLCDRAGGEIFADYIESGAMSLTPNSPRLLDAIREPDLAPADEIAGKIESTFAGIDATRDAFRTLLGSKAPQ